MKTWKMGNILIGRYNLLKLNDKMSIFSDFVHSVETRE